VNDLDLSGTVPPGRFTDITYVALRTNRMSEFRQTVTPRTLVCAVVEPWSSTRLIEYRGLSQGGFQFPVVGSGIVEDARHRDFSFNALLYDVVDHVVMDGCGTGLADLRSPKRRFVPLNESTDPAAQAMVLLRAIKFALRWHDSGPHDLEPLCAWLNALPEDVFALMTAEDRNGLVDTYRRLVSAHPDQQRELAAELPDVGRKFVETLIRLAS
jgi:hypothetical protein